MIFGGFDNLPWHQTGQSQNGDPIEAPLAADVQGLRGTQGEVLAGVREALRLAQRSTQGRPLENRLTGAVTALDLARNSLETFSLDRAISQAFSTILAEGLSRSAALALLAGGLTHL
jgi:hypothetical protein